VEGVRTVARKISESPVANRDKTQGGFCRRTRREFLWEAGGGFTSLALTGMLSRDAFFANQTLAADGVSSYVNPLAPKEPQLPAKAKSVIFLFMYGGPSHVIHLTTSPNFTGLMARLSR